jgi:hypothetical protein
MSIAEQRDAVRRKRQHLFDGRHQPFFGLQRQAVECVDVQRMDAGGAQRRDHVAGLFEGLRPVDRFLHGVGEILYADACACHAECDKAFQSLVGHVGGIDFDADFGLGADVEMLPQGARKAFKIRLAQHARRPPAEMQMRQPELAAGGFPHSRQFRDQRADIGFDRRVFEGVFGVAAAEPAKPVAKRDVQIERDGFACGQLPKPRPRDREAVLVGEMRRGRIARVARNAAALTGKDTFCVHHGHALQRMGTICSRSKAMWRRRPSKKPRSI